MLDFDAMFRRALTTVGDARVALATPYELPRRFALDLIAEGVLASMVADSAEHAHIEPTCAGWWIDRDRGRLCLRRGIASTLLIAGIDARQKVDARLLLEARLKGVGRVVTADWLGEVIEDLEVASALYERLDEARGARPIGSITYEEAFDILYRRIGDALRLQPWDFRDDVVALVTGSLGPGGAERQGAMTAVGLQLQGNYEAHVVCNYIDPPADFFRPAVESAGAKVYKLDREPEEMSWPIVAETYRQLTEDFGSLRFGEIFLEIVRYAAALRRIRPSIAHIWMDYCNTLCGTAAQLVGVPAVLVGGRSVGPNHFRIFQPYMRAGYQALFARRPLLMLNNSHAGGRDYEHWLRLKSGSVRVIHNGFDFPEPSAQARKEMREAFGIGEDQSVVGSILRFSEEKRPQLLIDMAAEMHARAPNTRFLFFGGGVMLDAMRAYVVSRNLADVVHLPGLAERSWDALAAMDLFALTSRMEGLPNVLIEAQATGLPVVCTGVGGMIETFVEGETGLSVRATPEALADAALAILADPARRERMSLSAKAHARQSFGMQRMIDDTIDAYAEAIRQPHKLAGMKVPA